MNVLSTKIKRLLFVTLVFSFNFTFFDMLESNHSKAIHIDKEDQSYIINLSWNTPAMIKKRNSVQSYNRSLINKFFFGSDSLTELTPSRAVGMPVVANKSNPSWSMLTSDVSNKTNSTEGVYVPGRGKQSVSILLVNLVAIT